MSKKYVYKSDYDTKMEIEFCIIARRLNYNEL